MDGDRNGCCHQNDGKPGHKVTSGKDADEPPHEEGEDAKTDGEESEAGEDDVAVKEFPERAASGRRGFDGGRSGVLHW